MKFSSERSATLGVNVAPNELAEELHRKLVGALEVERGLPDGRQRLDFDPSVETWKCRRQVRRGERNGKSPRFVGIFFDR